MTTTTDIENTLPLKAPEPAHPMIGPKKAVRYQVYPLVGLSQEETAELLQSLHQDEIGPHACRVVEEFQARSLREAFDYHIRVRDEDKAIHPYFFVAVETASPKSVLVVYLRAPGADGNHIIGVSRCATSEADLMGANLDVGNIGWIEYKEAEEADFEGQNPYGNSRYLSRDPTRSRDKASSAYMRCVYAWFSLVPRPLRFKSILEPGWTNLSENERRFGYPGNVHKSDDPWSEIRSLFPRMCQVNQAVHRKILLVAENEDVDAEKGMSIYRVLWEADKELSNVPNNTDQCSQQTVRSITLKLQFLEWTRASVALRRLDELTAEGTQKSGP